MNKNAYEIRLDILNMAHGDLVGQYHHKIALLERESEKSGEPVDETLITTLYPSTSEIIERAERLYKFVDTK